MPGAFALPGMCFFGISPPDRSTDFNHELPTTVGKVCAAYMALLGAALHGAGSARPDWREAAP